MQLSTISLAITRLGGSPFSPASLFAGGTVNGAWYDPSDATTLFSDRAGTTPCGTPGQGSVVPVGLMLDKSQGLVLGSELVTNGGPGFTATTGWTAEGTNTVAVVGGELEVTLNSALFNGIAGTNLTTVAGQWYRIVVTARRGTTASNFILRVDSASNDITFTSTNSTTVNYYFRASGTSAAIRFLAAVSSGAGTFYVTSVSVKAIAGNHAIAANDTTARPELRARVNLLTYSEQFDNAAWVKTRTTVSANTTATTDPLGGNTADKIVEGVFVGNDCSVDYGLFTHTASVNYTLSVYAKAAERTRVLILWPIVGANNPGIIVDLSTGTAAFTNGSPTVSISNAGNGWWRIALTVTSGTPVTNTIRIGPTANTTSFTGTLGYNGDGTSGIYLWGAQLTATNQFPANTYQRIADANTYDAVGFPRYLAFNGTSSAMSTPGNVNLSGTDKATVFAGVRKNVTTTTAGAIVEFSSVWFTNSGTFVMYAPDGNAQNFGWGSKGNTGNTPYVSPLAASQTSYVATGIGNIAGDVTQLRLNGAVAATDTTDAGTGNYGTYPLFIGSRNNASVFLNGNLYSLIVVGSAVSAGQISATEQWVAQRTGITI